MMIMMMSDGLRHVHRKFGEVQACRFHDMRADRQTDRHTDTPITSILGRNNYNVVVSCAIYCMQCAAIFVP